MDSKKVILLAVVAVFLIGYFNIVIAKRSSEPHTWTGGEISALIEDLSEIEKRSNP